MSFLCYHNDGDESPPPSLPNLFIQDQAGSPRESVKKSHLQDSNNDLLNEHSSQNKCYQRMAAHGNVKIGRETTAHRSPISFESETPSDTDKYLQGVVETDGKHEQSKNKVRLEPFPIKRTAALFDSDHLLQNKYCQVTADAFQNLHEPSETDQNLEPLFDFFMEDEIVKESSAQVSTNGSSDLKSVNTWSTKSMFLSSEDTESYSHALPCSVERKDSAVSSISMDAEPQDMISLFPQPDRECDSRPRRLHTVNENEEGTVGPYEGLQLSSLLEPSDRQSVSEFTSSIVDQMQVTYFKRSDRKGTRQLPVGFPGMSCLHCNGTPARSGRYFPASIKTISDSKKFLYAMHSHLTRCTKCPDHVKHNLNGLFTSHIEEKKQRKRVGNQRKFFRKIWLFLQPVGRQINQT